MNIKKKLKKFFTLQHRSEDGFTLVELIIVIAILAILAGAAVPMYNGYTAKAREAADQMIVAAANDAFAAACMENKVDAMNVSAAEVSVLEGKVYGLSSATYGSDTKFADKAASYFLTYFEGNGEMVFQTPGINSLIWNDTLDSFEMKEDIVATRVVLSSGKTMIISAEDMQKILASTYAEMGYSGIAAVVNELAGSSETMCSWAKGLGMLDKFTAVMYANGLLAEGYSTDDMSAEEAANGLQMVTAKYLAGASEEDIEYLLNDVKFDAGYSMLTGIVAGESGTKQVSAAALQYALVEAYANSDAASGQTITYGTGEIEWVSDSSIPIVGGYYAEVKNTVSVSEYLASDKAKEDPIKAMANVQNSAGYQSYKTTEQYTNDVNGFVGTMSILGDNLGTIKNPGAVSIDGYFKDGINSKDAEEGLTAVVGSGAAE